MDTTLKNQLQHFKASNGSYIAEGLKALTDGSVEALRKVMDKVASSKPVAVIANAVQSSPAKLASLKEQITSSVPAKFAGIVGQIYVLAVGAGLFAFGTGLLQIVGAVLLLWAVITIGATILEQGLDKILPTLKGALP